MYLWAFKAVMYLNYMYFSAIDLVVDRNDSSVVWEPYKNTLGYTSGFV